MFFGFSAQIKHLTILSLEIMFEFMQVFSAFIMAIVNLGITIQPSLLICAQKDCRKPSQWLRQRTVTFRICHDFPA
jgi:hypothetical protein